MLVKTGRTIPGTTKPHSLCITEVLEWLQKQDIIKPQSTDETA